MQNMTLPAGTYYQDDRYLEDGSKRYIDQQLAKILERNFTEANRYDQNSAGVALANGTAPLFSAHRTVFYNITLPTLTASTFILNAAPTGAQAGDPCGTYTLNQAGAKAVTGGTLTIADCW